MAFTFKREMTITYDDFMRVLPRAIGSHEFAISDQQIFFSNKIYTMQIKLSDQQQWGIGSLKLPRLQVEISLENCSEADANAVMRQFDRSYQKGGG
jgi:hypothetical protein